MLRRIVESRVMRGANVIVLLHFTLAPAIADALPPKYKDQSPSLLYPAESPRASYSLATRLTTDHPSAVLGAIKVELPKTRLASLGESGASVFLRCHHGDETGSSEGEFINLTSDCSSVFVYTTEPIQLAIPYRNDGIEQEIDESAIQVFRAQVQAASLGAIEPLDSFVDLPNERTVATLNEQSGNYVVGVLRNLEGPDRAAPTFYGQSLTGLLQANPLTGVPLIAKPSANPTGEARLSYPLDLPGARSDFHPAVSISYLSKSGYDTLGEGWHLTVPEITVETRWGVPIYDPDFETETYLFNGEQLVPETGVSFVGDLSAELQLLPMPHRTSYLRPRKKGDARFVLRRDDGLWRIIRHGDTPSDYWWEAWQEKSGGIAPKVSYFGLAPGRIPSAIEAATSAGASAFVQRLGPVSVNPQTNSISRWLLAREVDAHRNTIDYDWHIDCQTSKPSTDEGVCASTAAADLQSRTALLKRVLYTSNLATEETVLRCREEVSPPAPGCKRDWALYEALFKWTDVDKQYRRSDARSGGLSVISRRLNRIDVRTRQVVSDLGPAPLTWRCSKPFVGYEFAYKREFKVNGSDDIGSGSGRAFLRSITKQVSGPTPLFGPKNASTVADCGAPIGTWEEQFATRFDYDLDGERAWKKGTPTTVDFNKPSLFGLIDHVRDALFATVGADANKGPLAPSMLGSTATTDATISFFAGLNFFNPGKTNAIGVKAHNTKRTGFREATLLLDVDGDGITDVVVRRGEGAYDFHRGALDKNGHLSFNKAASISLPAGFSAFNREPFQSSNGFAFESHLFGTFFGAMSSKTSATQDSFVSDVNGDGRPDVISNGTVFFNTSQAGAASFATEQPGSYISPDIGTAGVPQEKLTTLLDITTKEIPLKIESTNAPRVDPVRAWRAPFSGDIFVHGAISFDPKSKPSDIEEQWTETAPEVRKIRFTDNRDGMLFTVERNSRRMAGGIGKVERCFAAKFEKGTKSSIPLTTPAPAATEPVKIVSCFEEVRPGWPDIKVSELPAELAGDKGLLLSVEAGDVVYFRAHSIENAQDDVVQFDPAIDYVRLSEDDVPPGESQTLRNIIYGVGASDKSLGVDAVVASVAAEKSTCGTLQHQTVDVDETVSGLCDPWGRSIVRYRATQEKDLFISGSGLMIAPFTGRAHFEGMLQKPATLLSGEVAIRILPPPPAPDINGSVSEPDPGCAVGENEVAGTQFKSLLGFGKEAGSYAVDSDDDDKHFFLEKGQRVCIFIRFHGLEAGSPNAIWPQDISAFTWTKKLTAAFDRRLLVVQLDMEGRNPEDLMTEADKNTPTAGLKECPAASTDGLVVKIPPASGEDADNPEKWPEKTLPVHLRCLVVDARYPQAARSAGTIAGHVFPRTDGTKATHLPSRRLKTIKLPSSELVCPSDSSLKEYRFRLDTKTLQQPTPIPMDVDTRRPHSLEPKIDNKENVFASVPYATKQTQISRIENGLRLPLETRAFIIRKILDKSVQLITDDHLSSDIDVAFERVDDMEVPGFLSSQIARALPRQKPTDVMDARNAFYAVLQLGQKVDEEDDGLYVYPSDRVGYSFCAPDEAEIEVTTTVENGSANDVRDDELLDNADCSPGLCPITASEIRLASADVEPQSVELAIFRTGRLPIDPESYRGWSVLGVTTEFKEGTKLDNDDGSIADPAVLSNEQAELAFDPQNLPTVRDFSRLRSRFQRAKDILGSADLDAAKAAAGKALHADAPGAPPCGAQKTEDCIRDKFTSQVRVHLLTGSYRATTPDISPNDWPYCTDNSWRRPPSPGELEGQPGATPLSDVLKVRAGIEMGEPHHCLIGPDVGLWISEGYMSASRLGAKDLVDPVAESLQEMRAAAPGSLRGRVLFLPRVSSTESEGRAASAWLGIAQTTTNTKSYADVFDLNGDGFADQIVQSNAYLSDPTGRLRCLDDGVWAKRFPCTQPKSGETISFGEAFLRESSGKTSSLSIPFSSPKTFATGVASASARIGAALSSGTAQAQSSRDPALSPLSIGAEFTIGDSARHSDLVDVNGDGMPDFASGTNVNLNAGYKFLGAGNWQGELSRERNLAVGLSGSLGYGDDIHQVGGGISASSSRSRQRQAITDVNGDGLADIVRADGQQVRARLNTGFGFGAEQLMGTLGQPFEALSQSESDTLGANAYFTYSIPIPLPFWIFYIILNPGASFGAVLNRQVIALRDIDGDGLGDLFVGGGLNVANNLNMMFDNRSATAFSNPYGTHGLLNRVYLPTNPSSKQETPTAQTANYLLRYARSTVSDNDPQSRIVLSEVIARDGITIDDAYGIQDRRTCHVYGGGFFERFERRFLGYSKVVSVEGCTTKFEDRFPVQSTTPLGDAGDHETSDALAGIRRVERTYANRSIYESGLLLSETSTDLSLPTIVKDGTGSKRKLENTYVLLDVGRSTYAQQKCFALKMASSTPNDIMKPVMRKMLAEADSRIKEPTCEQITDFNRQSFRLTPVLVQSVQTASEGGENTLETAVQFEFDHRARVRRMCDLGRLGSQFKQDDVCSELRYDDHIQLSFVHAATGGGTLAFDRRDRVNGLEVRVGPDSPEVSARKRTAAYDPATGDLLAVCQFEEPGSTANPCSSIRHIPAKAGDLLEAGTKRIAVRRYAYDPFGNLVRYVSPVSSDGYFSSKRFEFDPFQNLVQLAEHDDTCRIGGGTRESELCLDGSKSELGTFVSRSENVDWRHAVATTQIDINRNGLSTTLDGTGRPQAVSASWSGTTVDPAKPKVQWGQIATYEYRVAADLPASSAVARVTRFVDASLYKATDSDAEQTGEVTFAADYHFDHLGRQIRSVTATDVCIPGAETADGAMCDTATRATHVATGIVRTDAADREVERYLPIRLATLPSIANATVGPLPGEDLKALRRTKTTVDGFDRPLHVRLTDNNSYAFRYLLADVGGKLIRHRTVVRDARCVPTVIERNERGLIQGVHEFMTAGSGVEFDAHAYGSSGEPEKSNLIPNAEWIKPGGIDTTSSSQQVVSCVEGDAADRPDGPGYIDASLDDPFLDSNAKRRRSTTLYVYDALSQLTEVQLPRPTATKLSEQAAVSGKSVRVAYDKLGRRVAIDDPDRGFQFHSYDLVSNLACNRSGPPAGGNQDTFKARLDIFFKERLRQTLDGLGQAGEDRCLKPVVGQVERVVGNDYLYNRLKQVSYIFPTPVEGTRKNVSIEYGVADAFGANLVGRQISVTDVTGTTTWESYHPLGLPEKVVRKMFDLKRSGGGANPDTSGTLTATERYDVWGLLAHSTLTGDFYGLKSDGTSDKSAPKTVSINEAIRYRHSNGGQINEVRVGAPCSLGIGDTANCAAEAPITIVRDAAFDERGNNLRLAFGNGVVTRNAFDFNSNRLVSSASRMGVPCMEYGPGDDCSNRSPPILFQNLSYHYDAGGLLTAYENTPRYADAPLSGSAISKQDAGIQGLLMTGSASRFSYDERGRLRNSVRELSLFGRDPLYWAMDDDEFEDAKAAMLEIREDFAFSDSHLLTGIRRDIKRKFVGSSYGGPQTTTFKHSYGAQRATAPSGTRVTNPGTIESQSFGLDSFGRVRTVDCTGCLQKPATGETKLASRTFAWDPDDTLAGMRRRIERPSGADSTNEKKNKYAVQVDQSYDHASNRAIKRLTSIVDRPSGSDESVLKRETIYADGRLTVIRQPGAKPQALLHVFTGQARLASKRIGGASVFTYHAQLATGTVSDVIHTRGDDPTTVRLHQQLEYAAFGEMLIGRERDLVGENRLERPLFRFNAKEFDDESQLSYFGARHYDQRLGLWMSPDPAQLEYLQGKLSGGVFKTENLVSYGFGWGNPVAIVDPDGRTPARPLDLPDFKDMPQPQPTFGQFGELGPIIRDKLIPAAIDASESALREQSSTPQSDAKFSGEQRTMIVDFLDKNPDLVGAALVLGMPFAIDALENKVQEGFNQSLKGSFGIGDNVDVKLSGQVNVSPGIKALKLSEISSSIGYSSGSLGVSLEYKSNLKGEENYNLNLKYDW